MSKARYSILRSRALTGLGEDGRKVIPRETLHHNQIPAQPFTRPAVEVACHPSWRPKGVTPPAPAHVSAPHLREAGAEIRTI